MMDTISLVGQSERSYIFTCYAPETTWLSKAGCYAFVGHTKLGFGRPVTHIFYVGQTDSFERRMSEHQDDKWARAVRCGANMILACVVPSGLLRLAMEQDLIRRHHPPLNIQHVQQNALMASLPLYNRLLEP